MIPALAGYLFLVQFNLTRDRLSRDAGYHVVFKAAACGAVLFYVARAAVGALDYHVPALSVLWRGFLPIEFSGTASVCLVLGCVLPWILNLFPFADREKARRAAAKEEGNQIGLVIDDALLRNHMVELTLASGKSYVGIPVGSAPGDKESGDVAVIPMRSGYRDDETKTLAFTTNYAEVIVSRLDELAPEDFKVALPLRDIASARRFDPVAYRAFLDETAGGQELNA